MTSTPTRRPGRSNLLGAIVTLLLEASVVVALAVVGLLVSSLMLWLT